MAEELRIVLQDDGTAAALTQAASAATPPPPPVSSTPPPLLTSSPSEMRHNALLDEAFGLGTTPPPPSMPPPSEAPGVTGRRIQLVQIVAPLPLAVTILDLPPGALSQGIPAPTATTPLLPAAGTPGGPAGPPEPNPDPKPFDPSAAARTQFENEAKARAAREAYLTEQRPDLGFAQIAGAAGLGNLAKLTSSLGELSLATGPVTAAIAGIQALGAASAMAAGLTNATTQQIQLMGQQTVQVAGNDYLGAFQTGVQAAAAGLEQVPVVGHALASALKLTTAPVIAFAKVVEAFVERGVELARFSPEITAARAFADVRSILSDIREAQELGPGIASLTDSQSRIWNELRDILLPIKKFLVETLASILEGLADSAAIVGSALPPVGSVISAAGTVAAGKIQQVLTVLNAILKVVTGATDKAAVADPSSYMADIIAEIERSFEEEGAVGAGIGGVMAGARKGLGNKMPGDLGQGNLWQPGVAFGGAFP